MTFANSRLVTEKVLAVSFALIIAAFSCAVAFNYAGGMRKIMAEKSAERAALGEEKRGAYEWLSRFTSPHTRTIAYEDASLSLYADRPAMRPIIFTTDEFYDVSRLETSLDHITDVPRAIGADYWLFADDDYGEEWTDAKIRAHAQTSEIERVLPIVYRSPHGHVRVRYLGCIQHPESLSCRSADRVLFPEHDRPRPIELASH